jgi:guanylate kinase
MKKGLLIILSGPSGVGKGTVRSYLMQDKSIELNYSVSMTTRKPRPGEIEGKDYFFVSKKVFSDAVKEGKLLEHADFVDHSYGTPKEYVDGLINAGHNVLLEIETNGARQVMEKYKELNERYVSIFLVCQSIEELEKRIRNRKSETEEAIHKRVEKGKKELELQNNYMYVVLNDNPQRAAKEISEIIKKEQLKEN